MDHTFYDVLLVNKTATLDEIKVAFKRRALQVHPDKGGTKEEFHLVYQALETLSDPDARKRYDQSFGAKVGLRKPKREKKSAAASATKRKSPKQVPSKVPKGKAGVPPKFEAKESQKNRLLVKIHRLLTKLPREVRRNVIAKDFTQKQRLILERWMVDQADTPIPRAPVAELPLMASNNPTLGISDVKEAHDNNKILPSGSDMLTLTLPGDGDSQSLVATRTAQRGSKRKVPRMRSTCGSVNKNSGSPSHGACYRACIRFDAVDIYTGQCDLQTALDYLVILTSVKHKMLEKSERSERNFEERLQEAVKLSAEEQDKSFLDLNLRYAVYQRAAFFIGQRFQVRSPKVRSISELGKFRKYMEPFRSYAKHTQQRDIFWWYTPDHLKDAWERFQDAVAGMWQGAGAVKCMQYLTKVRACYDASANLRNSQLQNWERQHMGSQDRSKHRPRGLREKSGIGSSERWEGKRMAAEDQNKHRPRAMRERSCADQVQHRERQNMAREDRNRHRPRKLRDASSKQTPENLLSKNLFALNKILKSWDSKLKREARLAEQGRQRMMQQKKKERKQRERTAVLERKRVQKEERLRRQALRKRKSRAWEEWGQSDQSLLSAQPAMFDWNPKGKHALIRKTAEQASHGRFSSER